MKRGYHPNRELSVPEIDTKFSISPRKEVYWIDEHGSYRKAESLFFPRTQKLVINHKGHTVTVSGWNHKENKFDYEITEEQST